MKYIIAFVLNFSISPTTINQLFHFVLIVKKTKERKRERGREAWCKILSIECES